MIDRLFLLLHDIYTRAVKVFLHAKYKCTVMKSSLNMGKRTFYSNLNRRYTVSIEKITMLQYDFNQKH